MERCETKALEAYKKLPGLMTECSRRAGWSSVLLRRFDEPLVAEPFDTEPTPEQLIVLVKSGKTTLESFRRGLWHRAEYRPGDLGMIPAGETARLRWNGSERHVTLQLHVPLQFFAEAAEEIGSKSKDLSARLNFLAVRIPVVRHAILSLEHSAERGDAELHAETVVRLLALQLISEVSPNAALRNCDLAVLRTVEEFMQASLARPVTLGEIAEAVGKSAYQLIRLAKDGWGETPFEHLTKIRMDHACTLLRKDHAAMITVAFECGYTNPSHFAVAFRRAYGMSPSTFRKLNN